LVADYANAVALIVILGSTMFAIQCWLCRPKPRLRFHMRDLLFFTWIAAATFAVLRVQQFRINLPFPESIGTATVTLNGRHAIAMILPFSLPVQFAIACTIFTAMRIGQRGIGRVMVVVERARSKWVAVAPVSTRHS
jgi:hypothetical protein